MSVMTRWDGDAAGGEPGDRPGQEPDRDGRGLVGEDFDVGEPAGVVDTDMHGVPASTPVAGPGPGSHHPVARASEPAELLDVDVDQFARVTAAVTVGRLGRLQTRQPVQAQTTQHRTHRGRGHAELGGDAGAGEPAAAEPFDGGLDLGRGATGHRSGRGRPIREWLTGVEAGQPPVAGPFRAPGGLGGRPRAPAQITDSLAHQHSTVRGQAGVTVQLHGSPWGEVASAPQSSRRPA